VRYLVRARLKAGKGPALLAAIQDRSLGLGSVAGDEYIHNMQQARLMDDGSAQWLEVCFCREPLEEERAYWEEFFDLVTVKDAHSRTRCKHENGTEAWACCDCDCTHALEARLLTQGSSFLQSLSANVNRFSE
jgi:hypothetical protein